MGIIARVALYYPWIYLKGGGERLIRELVVASRHEWRLYTNHHDPDATFPELRSLDITELERVSVKRSLVPLVRAALTIRTQRLPLDGTDALVVVCEGFGDLVTFHARSTPTLCVCFTPLKIIHDDAAMARMRANHSAAVRAAYGVLAPVYRLVERAAWRHYRSVVAISGEVKHRIVSAGLADTDAVTVAYPGVTVPPAVPVSWEPNFLITGRIMWEKNLELGIDAFRHFAGGVDREGWTLTIAGAVDAKSRTYLEQLRDRSRGLRVEFVETPSADEMVHLYARCSGLLFTAPNEEFGIVVLEALSFGKPVVAVARGGPAEIVRDGIEGWLVAPEPSAMARAMERLAGLDAASRGELAARASARAASFTWARFAEAVDARIDAAVRADDRHERRAGS